MTTILSQSVANGFSSANAAKQLLRLKQARRQVLAETGEADPAWDLLVALYVAKDNKMGSTILGETAMIAPTTTLRWLVELEKQGLVSRRVNRRDRRVVLVSLTDKGKRAVGATFEAAIGAA